MIAARGASFRAKTTALVAKDIRIEGRARDTLPPMLAFALTVTLLLAFTLPDLTSAQQAVAVPIGTVALADVLSGFLWVTILFAGLIGFARTFEVERETGAIEPLLLVPLDRSGLFAAKAAVNLAFIVAVELVLVPTFIILFGLDVWSTLPVLLGVVALVDLGYVSIGTLFSSIAAQTRSRELILPILALPALVPIFIAAVELTSDVFLGAGFEGIAARGWFGILIAFDVIFCTLSALIFEFAIE